MRTRLPARFAALALGALVACKASTSTPGATGSTEDEQAIRAIADKYGAALSAKDTAALAQLVTQDYEEVDPTGKHKQGRAAFTAAMAQDFAMMPAGMSMTMKATTDFIRWVDANHAVAGGTWETTPAMPPMPSKGSWLAVMAKEGDTWRMMSGLGAPDMTPLMPAPADTTKKP